VNHHPDTANLLPALRVVAQLLLLLLLLGLEQM
jgi:hypothetical protein